MPKDTKAMPDEFVLDDRLIQLYQHLTTARSSNKKSIHEVVNHLHSLHAPSTSTSNKNRSNSDIIPRSRAPRNSCKVISSSSNLKNILKNQKSRDNVKSIVSPTAEELRNRVNSQETTHSSSNISNRQNRGSPAFETISPNKNIARRLQYSPDAVEDRTPRIFANWRVTLDEENQMRIIKTTECGQLILSKPIVRRLTSTTVESVHKHLYLLEGNLVDDERELPKYVYDKFYNGFPDDWKEVYKLWQAFVQGGSQSTFRWWTETLDNDNSKTIIIGSTCPRDNLKTTTGSNCFKRPQKVRPLNFERTFTIPQSDKNEKNYSQKDDISIDTRTINTSEKSSRSIAVQTPVERCFFGEKNCEKRENIFSNCSCAKRTKDEIMNRLNEIIDYLMDENCSPEYMNAFAEMLRFMDYFTSLRLKKDEVCAKDLNVNQSECMVEKNNETGSVVRPVPEENCAPEVVQEHVPEINIIEKEVENTNEIHEGTRSVIQKLPSRESDINSSSDSLYNNDNNNDINSVPHKDSKTVRSRRSETNDGDLTFIKEKSEDSINAISVGLSSRGRRIVPPLCYWTGERIVSINNKPTYSPATSQIVSMYPSSSNTNKGSNKTNTQQANKHQRNSSRKLRDRNVNSIKKGTNTAGKSTDNSKRSKSNKNVRRNKGRAVQMQSNDLSDEENIPLSKRHKVDENRDEERNIAGTSKKGSTTFRSNNVVYRYSLNTSLQTTVLSDDLESCI